MPPTLLLLRLSLLAALAALGAGAALPPGFAAYDGSAAMLRNPERGFRFELDFPFSLATLADALALNCTLVQTYAYLPASNPPLPLPQSVLDELDAGFGALRAAGMKAVLRFAYDRLQPGEQNYTFETVALHQQNLMSVVAYNADVIFVLEAGFVGSWGEWHSSKNALEANETGLSALVANELYGGLGLPRELRSRPRTWAAHAPRKRRSSPHLDSLLRKPLRSEHLRYVALPCAQGQGAAALAAALAGAAGRVAADGLRHCRQRQRRLAGGRRAPWIPQRRLPLHGERRRYLLRRPARRGVRRLRASDRAAHVLARRPDR